MEELANNFIALLQDVGLSEDVSINILRVFAVAVILLVAFVVDLICRKAIVPLIKKLTLKTEFKWDDYLLGDNVLHDICRLVTPIAIYALLPFMLPEDVVLKFLMKVCQIYIIVVFTKLICTILSSLYMMSNEHEKLRNHTMKGLFQMLKLVVICVGVIIIISALIGKNPLTILAGLGASTAILMLVFQDTIKGFVAGVQLIANDMLRPGDWIVMSKYGADGDVLEVTLTTVKVQNWDKTITTIPPYALVNDSFQNYRGMFDAGGRRVKRSLNIDMYSVRFCTEQEFSHYKEQPWMQGFEETGKDVVNLHLFRHYVEHYLRNHPKINKKMTILVRPLQPTPQGMPIELYFFSADTAWANYEALQAEVFDHILAVLHTFGLRVFQTPSGTDLHKVKV